MSGADDLFSSEAPAPPEDRLRRAAVLLGIAFPLTVLGAACFTGVPGAVLALLAWHTADEEIGRIESGVLSAQRLPRARQVRGLAFALLGFSILSLTLQVALFSIGFYEGVAQAVMGLVTGEAPVSTP